MKKKNNRFAMFIAVAVILAVVGGLAFFGFQIVRDMITLNQLKTEKADLQRELNSVANGNAALQQEIDQSDSDTFIERLARELLGWVKPGEIKIVDENKK